jgi:hypothetical protein
MHLAVNYLYPKGFFMLNQFVKCKATGTNNHFPVNGLYFSSTKKLKNKIETE